jgi:hypothetical protein
MGNLSDVVSVGNLSDVVSVPNSVSDNRKATHNELNIVPLRGRYMQVDVCGATTILRAQSTPILYQGMPVLSIAGFHQHLLFLFYRPPPSSL